VQLHELLHEGESNAATFDRAPACTLNTMEALENVRQVVLGDARARIGHAERDAAVPRFERDADLALERELERVREQIEDDLFPHLAIDERGRVERGASDDEA
jgi:hypothetical protein